MLAKRGHVAFAGGYLCNAQETAKAWIFQDKMQFAKGGRFVQVQWWHVCKLGLLNLFILPTFIEVKKDKRGKSDKKRQKKTKKSISIYNHNFARSQPRLRKQYLLGHWEDHLVVVAQKHLKDCDGSMRSFRGVQEVLPKRYSTNQETEMMELSEIGLLWLIIYFEIESTRNDK